MWNNKQIGSRGNLTTTKLVEGNSVGKKIIKKMKNIDMCSHTEEQFIHYFRETGLKNSGI